MRPGVAGDSKTKPAPGAGSSSWAGKDLNLRLRIMSPLGALPLLPAGRRFGFRTQIPAIRKCQRLRMFPGGRWPQGGPNDDFPDVRAIGGVVNPMPLVRSPRCPPGHRSGGHPFRRARGDPWRRTSRRAGGRATAGGTSRRSCGRCCASGHRWCAGSGRVSPRSPSTLLLRRRAGRC